MSSPPQAIILAAGKGTRMGPTDLPKVLYEVAGRPMVHWVIKAAREAGVERCILVIGYQARMVRDALADEPDCSFVEQTEQLGTAHATSMARDLVADQGPVDLFVLAGDGPLIQCTTLHHFLEIHRRSRAAATLATAVLDDPDGYGRIVRDQAGRFEAIVEQKDADTATLAIREINPSYYCFRSDDLFKALDQVSNDNRQGEYYLTDVPGLLMAAGKTVTVVDAVPANDVLSINTPKQLQQVSDLLTVRLARQQTAAADTP